MLAFRWLIYFFFNDPATTQIYPLSLHDALPIWPLLDEPARLHEWFAFADAGEVLEGRSEEHTSELQSRRDLVCCLLRAKKKVSYPDLSCRSLIELCHSIGAYGRR